MWYSYVLTFLAGAFVGLILTCCCAARRNSDLEDRK